MSILDLVLLNRKRKRPFRQEDFQEKLLTFHGFGPCSNAYSEQRPSSLNFDPKLQIVLTERGFKVKIKRGTKRVTIFRYLLSKLIYDLDGLHLDEYLVLLELYYSLTESKDPSLLQKYGKSFVETIPFFKILGEGRKFPLMLKRIDVPEVQDYYIQYLGNLLLSKESYFGMRGNRNIRDSFYIQINYPLFPRKEKTKRFIGVGYKDKGSRQNLAEDGSPAWQEVASEYSQVERALSDIVGEERATTDGPTPFKKE